MLDEYRFAATSLGIVYSLVYVLLIGAAFLAALWWQAEVIGGLLGAPTWVGLIIVLLPVVWLVVDVKLLSEE